jgi:hypothetical protein
MDAMLISWSARSIFMQARPSSKAIRRTGGREPFRSAYQFSLLPFVKACMTWSMLKLAAFWRGG